MITLKQWKAFKKYRAKQYEKWRNSPEFLDYLDHLTDIHPFSHILWSESHQKFTWYLRTKENLPEETIEECLNWLSKIDKKI